VIPFRGDGFFVCQKAFNEHLPCFLANTCLALHSLTKVFTNSPRQVVSNWNCFWSNYRLSLEKKQVGQVFYQRVLQQSMCCCLIPTLFQRGSQFHRILQSFWMPGRFSH